ncbi:MAG TPA: hypothetical protein VFF06_27850 [Polyangia bacterium]|nr:hypothetical protein [Polyangia bacterium]
MVGSSLSSRALALAAVCAGGCTDVFLLPYDGGNLPFGDGAANRDGTVIVDGDGAIVGDGGGGMDAPLALPASCTRLACVPAMNEGDVTLSDGTQSGCHAYGKLTIDLPGIFVGSSGALGFAACADTIVINGFINADGQGLPEKTGTGAGSGCGSGAGHGGAGADPIGCGAGITYGDPVNPRELGSGGGGANAGAGGGAIELQAGTINVIGIISANGGSAGVSLAGGGGSGGSVLLHADTILGAGKVYARGGLGVGAGGGGGGGRIAVYSGVADGISCDAKGGPTMSGGADGSPGSIMQLP